MEPFWPVPQNLAVDEVRGDAATVQLVIIRTSMRKVVVRAAF